MRTSLIAAVSLLLPAMALAEGATRSFSCTTETGEIYRFVIDPMETDATGKGPILVTFNGTSYAGVSACDHGPFQFGTEGQHYALLLQGTNDAGALTAQLHHATPSTSTLTNLICETDF